MSRPLTPVVTAARRFALQVGEPKRIGESPSMRPTISHLAGALLMVGSVALGYPMVQARIFEAWEFSFPLLGFWAGWMLVIQVEAEGLARLRSCYLVKSLMWLIPVLYNPDWSDWHYWQSLIPNAYFCRESDLRNIAMWCAAENLAMTFAIARLVGGWSLLPFLLAILSGIFGMAMRNPLCLATAAYTLRATCPSSAGRLVDEESELEIGFSPEQSPGRERG